MRCDTFTKMGQTYRTNNRKLVQLQRAQATSGQKKKNAIRSIPSNDRSNTAPTDNVEDIFHSGMDGFFLHHSII